MSTCTIDTAYMKPGMRIGRTVLSDKGQVLAPSGTSLTAALIRTILDANILHLVIQDDPGLKLPPEARVDETFGGMKTDAAMATTEGWISMARHVMLECIREKKLDIDNIKSLAEACMGRLKTESPYAALVAGDPNGNFLFHHTHNVCVLGVAAAQGLGLPAAAVMDIFVGAIFHDVGMLQVPEHMWVSPKPLTRMFRSEIDKHPAFGCSALRRTEGASETLVKLVMDHHERLDGSGYPDRKVAADLDLPSRIVAAADVYAALLMPRPWRPPFSPDKAAKEMLAQRDKFDQKVVGRLVQIIGIFPVGCTVKLSDGRVGVVSESRPKDLLHPLVTVAAKNRPPQPVDLAASAPLAVLEILSTPHARTPG
ncbi:MAG: hypothetical protein A3G34_08905 [Candidatus Lindowbacteria bacterium RIFCSPLOWO2_12_FULL_62_27]|nr:MAG: hypothetical protein A3I06_08765 [Candidatus Lindowbacteria bacterium RIFCSPLOWO2_02_FULL_62_12]OGH60816.1 MAG: hypothetical protein A3G34_08905 [Candidatus Lindowbacteria bacterium RIFCSPLOWO2_12_FULL_62_27]